jgi:uncharacterized DUF497 family protein
VTSELMFDWDAANRRHLWRHRVSPLEFEQVLKNWPLDEFAEVVNGEERWRQIGITDKGRLLVVVWSIRGDKIRPITAFPAGAKERQRWARAN